MLSKQSRDPSKTQRPLETAPLQNACMPVIENLEGRTLFALDTVQSLPFALDFNASVTDSILDKDGQGTGLTRVQANKLGDEYQAALIDLDTAAGLLKLTTTGTSVAGSNTNGDNTLVNALETQFNASTSGFKVTTRLKGPLDYINTASEQGGVFFGPDQDNYVKLVAVSQNGQQYLQFMDEQTSGTTYSHALGFNNLTGIGSFASITTLDLQLVGDAAAGTVNAYYSVNGGAFIKITGTLTLTGTKKAAFFNATGRAGLVALHKNDQGPITVAFDRFSIEPGTAVAARPAITATRPAAGEIGVRRDIFIAADVSLPTPGAGVDPATLTSATVLLYRTSDHALVGGVLNTSGGGDAIVLTPSALLDANTSYTFEVTDGVKDTSGAAFVPFSMSFTTGTLGGETDPSLAFEKVELPTATGSTYTSVAFGPDGKLYAATIDGVIQRFTPDAEGRLSAPQNITSLQTKEGGPRLVTGLAFDPASTAGNLILWVSHNEFTDVTQNTASDWTGKISRMTGSNLQNVTTAVINLPRSVRDHLTNQMAFGPDGALYISQGSNTAMGAPDNAWGLRAEHLLNAAILRLNTTQVGATPIDVKTDSGGTYNPYAAGAPLTLYATGVRNAYDLVWRNGKLFAATNGSAAGGSTPGSPAGSTYGQNVRIDFASKGTFTSPGIPALSNVPQTQSDYIFNVVQGGYYGHPNSTRGEFVLNGGNPTASVDPNEVPAYPVGTMPDRNYRGNITGSAAATQGSAYPFGLNYSPNGILEYKGAAFNNALKGKLLVAAYSGADEVFVLTVDSNGIVTNRQSGIAGLTHFTDPLDIVENPANGFLYVSEFGGQKLTLVRPITPGANVSTSKSQMVFNDATTAGASPAQKITITNTGTSALTLNADALSIVGTDSARFAITQKPALPAQIDPGDSVEVFVTFTATTVDDIRTASLQIKSNDEDQATILIPLRGLGMSTLTGGTNEPSLQQIMDLYRIPIEVGDSTPNETNLNVPPVAPNDEIEMPLLIKEGNGPVTIEPLAVFGVGDSNIPTFRFGTYTPGNKNDTSELLKVIGVNNSQSVNPNVLGATSFDPGASAFGLYTYWQKFTATGSPTVYSEDRLNESYDPANPRKLRFYALRTPEGTVVPHAYVFAWEEFNNGTDQQDFVGIIRNVRPAALGAEIGFENLDGPTFSTHLAFNKIQQPANTDPVADNIFHSSAKLRIRNTGTAALVVDSVAASSGWTVTGAPTGPIAPGDFVDVTVNFVANPNVNAGQLLQGTLTINSNDADEPTSTISLSGWWQPRNEDNKEPSLQSMFSILGYKTVVAHPGQTLGTGNGPRIGDEVRSAYWNRADTTLPVSVRQVAAWHGQGNTERFAWHLKTSSTVTQLFVHDGDEGQSFLPHVNNATVGVVGTGYAAGTFSPSATFGFKIQGDSTKAWSDPLRNASDQWEVRLWAARDRDGKIIPNAYLMTMDYFGTAGTNFDFNDNVYLITNIKPESAPSSPTALGASASGAGIALNWNDNAEPNLAGYNIYRASSETGTYTKLNSTLLSSSDYLDVTAPLGSTSWYHVTAVDSSGNESAASGKASAARTNDTLAPAAPSNLFATPAPNGINLDWANNGEADLAGYRVYRSSSLGGTYVQLNGLLTSSSFFDSTAPVGQVSYYRVSAVDTSGNESAVTPTNATRPSSDSTAPAAPAGLGATGAIGGITVDWSNSPEGDLAGYNIYRSDAPNGTYTKLNTSGLLTASQYLDATAPAGVTSYYRVTAVDTSSNESAASQTNAARPADTTAPAQPTGLSLVASTAGITLNWNNNGEADLAGYYVYRSDAASGTFTKLNTTILLASNYNDTTAPQGVASYYRVTAVDASENESTAATGNATRPVPDTLPPAMPAGLDATAGASGNALDWADNIEPDLAGYNVYRASSAGGPWTKLNSAPVAASTYLDASAPAGTSYYRVSAIDSSDNESGFATANVTRVASFTKIDIGNPTPAGSLNTIVEGSDYNLLGGGSDVYGTSDSFAFAYQQLSGDFDITVRLAGLTDTNTFAKAGLMARESLVANSRNAFVLATPGANGHRFTYRGTTGGSTTSTGSGATSFPNNYLRLARVGNVFTGYRSTNGTTWTQIGSTTIAMGQNVFVGMAAVSKNASAATTAQFRGLSGFGSSPTDPAPAQPTGLSATGSQDSISLDWANNTESDLAGYNVYRASSVNGTYTKINASLLTSSQYTDTTAPQGQTSYYRVVAVDDASHESTPATASALRPNPTDTTPPAAPTGLGATGAEGGITVNWTANSDGDLAGYNVYRSSSANGTFTKLNTSGLLTGTSFIDTTAPQGQASFYRLTAVDLNANESTFAATSATRPNPTVDGPIKINFQVTGSPGVAGYEQDNGAAFGNRGNGYTYGWNVNHTDQARDRNKNANQLVDTLVHMRSGSNWSINVPNGTYLVKVSVGDSQYATTNTININGVNYWTNQAQATNTFASRTMTVTVSNGKITVNNGSSADLSTRINYIEITPTVAPIKVNFQPAGAPTVSGYGIDSGLVFGSRSGGLSYGWNADLSDQVRDRNKNANQLLDTLVHLHTGSSWSINVANGTYSVKVGVGDSGYATTNTINVNGVNYWTNQSLGVNAFATKTMTVTVTSGKITLNNGASADLTTRLNYIEITQI